MMEGLESLPADQEAELHANIAKLKANRQGIILGNNHLRNTNKRIGERLKLNGISISKGLDLEFEIVGSFPPGRYDTNGRLQPRLFHQRARFLSRNAQRAKTSLDGTEPEPDALEGARLGGICQDSLTDRVVARVYPSPPPVRCETMASGLSSMLESFRDLIWGMRWFLVPSCLATVLLVIANAISISVRERRIELAVMKVLGFRPYQILILVLGESLLLGGGAGFLSAGLTYAVINWAMGGLSFPHRIFRPLFHSARRIVVGPGHRRTGRALR